MAQMLESDEAFILDAHVEEQGMVYPMIPVGRRVDEIMALENE